MDDSLCGGGDISEGVTSTAITLSAAAITMVKAAIFMGDPRYISGLSYEVGTCTAHGVSTTLLKKSSQTANPHVKFAARPTGFSCPSAANIQSYCDESDPYCCTGSNAATHNGYGAEYGAAALTFIKSKVTA
jgi:acetylxylan esterase